MKKAIIFLSIFMSTVFCMDTPPDGGINNIKDAESKKIFCGEKSVSRYGINPATGSPIQQYSISREQLKILFLIKAIHELEEPNKSEN